MGNSDLQKFPKEGEGLQLRNPPSPKLVFGNMSQSKTSIGSPKSSKSLDDAPKSDGVSSSPQKSARSPSSTKSSPTGNKSLSLAERLAQSTRGKGSTPPRSPGSKSPPTSPNLLTSSKTEVSKESIDQCLKSDEAVVENVCNGDIENKMDNLSLSNDQHPIELKTETNEPDEINQDINTSMKPEVILNEVEKCDSKDIVVIEDGESSIKPLRIDDSVILELTTKKEIRQKVWEFMEENSLVVFPKPCFNRIPNFKGCNNASLFLEKLDEFKKAKTVQVTPDKAQETARFLTLSWGKRLLVPLLRLKEGLLQVVSLPFAEPTARMLRSASTQKGLRKWGNKLITLDQNNDGYHIDMVILGSVAVDKKGHRLGIGNGYCDLEFVILRSMNMVTDKTVIVTIVHDVQVFDSLPSDIFKPYDVPVDIIITPTEIIRVENGLDRPKDVFWNYISKRRILEMPPLQLLHATEENSGGKDCTLKDVDSEPEEIPPSPKTFKKPKGYRHRRTYSTRSETNDSVFKDSDTSKHRSTSKQPSASVTKSSDSKSRRKRAKSTSSQQQRSNSVSKQNSQTDKKEQHSIKKPNKRRTKSESAKTVTPTGPNTKNSYGIQTDDSPSIVTPKNQRRFRQKPRQRVQSEDLDKSIRQSNIKMNGNINNGSRSNSRATRRDYIDHQDFDRDMSVGRNSYREFVPSPKKYYSQSRRPSSCYSQERPHGNLRSNSRVQQRDTNRPLGMQKNRYPNGSDVRPTRYFNGPMVRHNSYNSSTSRQNGSNNHVRHNSYTNDTLPRQNSYYEGVVTRHNSYSNNGSAIRQNGYTNSRIFRQPQYRNGMVSPNDERDYLQESRPGYINNNNRPGYFNSTKKQNYSRSISGDEFVLKVGNIANNVRVRDLKSALMERGVKPMHITWRGPRGFAYLRYNNSIDVDKDIIIGSLQNVRIKPNGVETAQTQTLIVTECQFS